MAYLGENSVLMSDEGAKSDDAAKSDRTGGALGSAINTTLGLVCGIALGMFLLTYGATEAVAVVLANLF